MPLVSLICTVLNEEASIGDLLRSIAAQTRIPNEVVIVDGGSSDATVPLLKKARRQYPHLHLRVVSHPSNRSGGRNKAVEVARYDTIAITDAGCILDPDWLELLVKKRLQTGAAVIAGYYRAQAETPFEEAVIPYALVMPSAVNSLSFLPATRSMLLSKSVFEQVGFFREDLEVSEDYEFAQRLVAGKVPIVFEQEATVVWKPRSNVTSFFRMVLSMAHGDVLGGVTRSKALLVCARYALALGMVVAADVTASLVLYATIGVLCVAYAVWAVAKNAACVTSKKAYLWLLVLQGVSDVGVIVGTLQGGLARLWAWVYRNENISG